MKQMSREELADVVMTNVKNCYLDGFDYSCKNIIMAEVDEHAEIFESDYGIMLTDDDSSEITQIIYDKAKDRAAA